MLKRLLVVLVLAFAPPPALADAASVRDRIISELREDGYSEIRTSRTLLGRLRFLATRADARREIVVNPNTGLILRDYVRFFSRSGSGSGSDGSDGFDDDENDDEDDDDYDDDYDDESDDDDDDDDDNSGSGSDDESDDD